ncbi:MAG: hypothetical protein HFI09_03820, partial [Bacilli bacterium]|nr:hypothetical protein [Bacilli bacterium]
MLGIYWFVAPGFPWFYRGCGFSVGASAVVFAFDYTAGAVWNPTSFRVV